MFYINVNNASEKWNLTERRITALCRAGRILGAKKKAGVWMIPNDAEAPIDARTKEYAKSVNASSTENEIEIEYSKSNTRNLTAGKFEKLYRKKPEHISFTPYRICPVGAHVDHQLGKITGFAIDKGIYMAYGPKMNGVIEIASMQFPKRAQWHIISTPPQKQNDWADHLRGATIALGAKYPLRIGLCAIINGELPIGGLSSSAAVIITFLSALCKLNNINLSADELIDISKEAENNYSGVSCGKLDQSCEVYCRKDKLLFMDIKQNKHEVIPAGENLKPYKILVVFSGLERSLASSNYNMRVDECRSAAYALKAFSGLKYGKYIDTNLCDVPYEVYLKYKDKLPENWKKRAEHWYKENQRVEKAVKAWKNGDLETFGKICFESGKSSIENWETGSPELIKIYEILKSTKGVYGGRFSGAGFKGCCIAIINPEFETEILQKIENEYLTAFPEMKGKYSAHICNTADGVIL